MDFTTFSFEASLAILIALLAWGDQIRKPRELVSEVENKFLLKLKTKRTELNPILHDISEENSKYFKNSLTDIAKAAVKLMDSGELNENTIPIITKVQELNASRSKLEHKYQSRYFETIFLDIWFTGSGLLSLLNGSNTITTFEGKNITFDIIYGAVLIAIGAAILMNLIATYFKENSFVHQTEQADDLVEAN